MNQYTIDQLFKMNWNELTPKEIMEVVTISEQLSRHEAGTIEHGYYVIQMLKLLRKNKSAVAKINEEQAVDCFNDITFFNRNEKGEFITPWLFFPVGNFISNNEQFYRPELVGGLPMFNIIFDQLVYADAAFSAFCVLNYQHEREELLRFKRQLQLDMDEAVNSLIAALYSHPQNFDVKKLEVLARLVPLKLTQDERSLILHTYANARAFITNRCPNLFPKQGEQEASEPVTTGEMWMHLRYELAETKAFSGFETARKTLIYDALDFMEKKALEQNQQKETAHV